MSKVAMWRCDGPGCEVTAPAKEQGTDYEIALPSSWFVLNRGTWGKVMHFHSVECLRDAAIEIAAEEVS